MSNISVKNRNRAKAITYSKMTINEIKTFKNQIANGEILEVLDVLQSKSNDFLVLKANLKHTIKDQIRGFLNYEQYQGAIARITYQTLSILDEKEEEKTPHDSAGIKGRNDQLFKLGVERFEDPLASLREYSKRIDHTTINEDKEFFTKLGNSLLFITRKNLNLDTILIMEQFFNIKIKEKYWGKDFISNNNSIEITTRLIHLGEWIANGRKDSRVFTGVQKMGKLLINFSGTLNSIPER